MCVEGLDVGDGIGARSSTDGRLIDEHDFVDPLVAFELGPGACGDDSVGLACLAASAERLVEDLVNESGFAGT